MSFSPSLFVDLFFPFGLVPFLLLLSHFSSEKQTKNRITDLVPAADGLVVVAAEEARVVPGEVRRVEAFF